MDIFNKTISELRELIRTKAISPREIFIEYKKRITKHNPSLHAFLTVIDEAVLDETRHDKPLYGIPFSMKDTYCTQGIRTTAGSKVLEKFIPHYNATVYNKLLDAGAVLIGKTNCDAWGHGSSTENSDYGPTKNPWNTEYVPGGSSGGSAASLAADMSVFDIGEDTGGSIRLPASFCNVVGLKVTYGLVSRYGCIAYASSLDTVGPFAKSVQDIAAIIDIIAGHDPYDATSIYENTPSCTKDINKDVKGLKIGIPKEYFGQGLNKEVAKAYEQSLEIYKKLGMKVVEISLPMTQYAISTYYLIAVSETSSNLSRYDSIRFGDPRSHFGSEAKRRIMLGTYTLSAGYYDAYYKKATKVRTLIKKDFIDAFEEVDAILAPVSPTAPFKIGEKATDPMQMYLSDIYTVTTNLAGVPALAVPAGFSKNNLPIGVQLIGKHFDEAKLLNIGYKYEQEYGGFNKIKPRLA